MANETFITTQQGLVGQPLWLEVKRNLYWLWNDANEEFYKIDKDRMSGLEGPALETTAAEFKARVLKLYRACRSKLHYQPHNSDFQNLKQLDLVLVGKDNANSLSFNFTAMAFLILTDFLERDGVTKFEKKPTDPMHGGMEELE